MTKVFITKYALSSGVIIAEMEVKEDGKSCFGKPNGFYMSTEFFGDDFHLTENLAKKDFEIRKLKKIKTLTLQLSKLDKLEFKIAK